MTKDKSPVPQGPDYNGTLNLPKTEFPMRANLSTREPEQLRCWDDENIYRLLMERNAGKPSFILHDGPPYANGDIHAGHALNKIIKDFIVKYKNMSGYRAPYVPGWDTHGLPIENQTIKKLGVNRGETSDVEYRKICEDFARKYIGIQREQFKRIGVIGEWDDPYLTLTPSFEAAQIRVFGEMARKGYIYKGMRPVYWCPSDETALAEAEIEYSDDKCSSIYVRFLMTDDRGALERFGCDTAYIIIWTTTPWTLPGNTAIALGPDFDYAVVRSGAAAYIMADALWEDVCRVTGLADAEKLGTVKGKELEYARVQHPFLDRKSVVIVGDHVTLDTGTGCVHTAPGHGVEDFNACKGYDCVELVVPLDGRGYMTAEAGPYAGLYYDKANQAIIDDLSASGAIMAVSSIVHPYPHCWRCHSPIVYRATEQWFCSIDKFRKEAIDAIHTVKWIPAWGEERMVGMVEGRSDWCISRQRKWGVPMPIFYCENCGKELINAETIENVARIFEKEGSNAWYTHSPGDFVPAGTVCSACGCGSFRKETDIMDVWFDSGSSHAAVLETRDGLSRPADIYLEGNDQHRGWFQSSLLTSVAVTGKAPYRAVITHGMVVDGEGRKMSKSLGNGIDPNEIIREYGADILRLWASSADYQVDVHFSYDIIKQMSEVYRKIRNTARFILGNLDGYDPSVGVPESALTDIDRWALIRLSRMTGKVREAYDNYAYHLIYHAIHNFCVVDMSNFYLDVIKDRLYVEPKTSQRRMAAQQTMYTILDTIVRLIAPILSFTAEEIWKFMPHAPGADTRSVFLNDMPDEDKTLYSADFERRWDILHDLRDDVKKSLENARASKLIGASLEADITLYFTPEFEGTEQAAVIRSFESSMNELMITSGASIVVGSAPDGAEKCANFDGVSVLVSRAGGRKCARCWVYSDTVSEGTCLCGRCAKIVEAMK